jgi:membrane-bound ClpP family serine protease
VNGSQIFVLVFAILVAALSIWAVVAVIRSPKMRHKPAYIIGSLIGFIGIGINWTAPDGLVFIFGISIPPISIRGSVATGQLLVRASFPLVALMALMIVYVAPDPPAEG